MSGWRAGRSPLLAWVGSGISLGFSAPGFDCGWLAWVALVLILHWLMTLEQASGRMGLRAAFPEGFVRGACLGAAWHAVWTIWLWRLHPLDWLGVAPPMSLLVAAGAWMISILVGALCYGLILGLSAALLSSVGGLGPRWMRRWVLPVLVLALCGSAVLRLSTAVDFGVPLVRLAYGQSWVLGWMRPATPVTLPVPVAILQGNLPIDTVRTAEKIQQAAISAYLTPLATMDFPAGTLVVLPEEGALPGWVETADPEKSWYIRQLQGLARRRGWTIIAGASVMDGDRAYNGLVMLSPDDRPAAFYFKRIRVPFGETIPYVDKTFARNALSAVGIDFGDGFDAGPASQPLFHLETPAVSRPVSRLAGLICFELLYPDLATQARDQGADILVNASNLGWFHEDPLLAAQFRVMGQFRAAEAGRPLIVAANTGISAVIGPDGRILVQLPTGEPGWIFCSSGRARCQAHAFLQP